MAGPHPPHDTVGNHGPQNPAESPPLEFPDDATPPPANYVGQQPPVHYPKRRSKRRLVIGLALALAVVAALTVAIVYGVRTNGANTGGAFSEGAAKTAIQGYLDALEHRDIDEIADPGNTDTEADPTLTHQAAGNIVALGRTLLAAPEVGVGAQFWTEQELALQQIPPVDFAAVLDGPIAAMSAALYEVRDANWAHLEALEQYGREGEPVPAV